MPDDVRGGNFVSGAHSPRSAASRAVLSQAAPHAPARRRFNAPFFRQAGGSRSDSRAVRHQHQRVSHVDESKRQANILQALVEAHDDVPTHTASALPGAGNPFEELLSPDAQAIVASQHVSPTTFDDADEEDGRPTVFNDDLSDVGSPDAVMAGAAAGKTIPQFDGAFDMSSDSSEAGPSADETAIAGVDGGVTGRLTRRTAARAKATAAAKGQASSKKATAKGRPTTRALVASKTGTAAAKAERGATARSPAAARSPALAKHPLARRRQRPSRAGSGAGGGSASTGSASGIGPPARSRSKSRKVDVASSVDEFDFPGDDAPLQAPPKRAAPGNAKARAGAAKSGRAKAPRSVGLPVRARTLAPAAVPAAGSTSAVGLAYVVKRGKRQPQRLRESESSSGTGSSSRSRSSSGGSSGTESSRTGSSSSSRGSSHSTGSGSASQSRSASRSYSSGSSSKSRSGSGNEDSHSDRSSSGTDNRSGSSSSSKGALRGKATPAKPGTAVSQSRARSGGDRGHRAHLTVAAAGDASTSSSTRSSSGSKAGAAAPVAPALPLTTHAVTGKSRTVSHSRGIARSRQSLSSMTGAVGVRGRATASRGRARGRARSQTSVAAGVHRPFVPPRRVGSSTTVPTHAESSAAVPSLAAVDDPKGTGTGADADMPDDVSSVSSTDNAAEERGVGSPSADAGHGAGAGAGSGAATGAGATPPGTFDDVDDPDTAFAAAPTRSPRRSGTTTVGAAPVVPLSSDIVSSAATDDPVSSAAARSVTSSALDREGTEEGEGRSRASAAKRRRVEFVDQTADAVGASGDGDGGRGRSSRAVVGADVDTFANDGASGAVTAASKDGDGGHDDGTTSEASLQRTLRAGDVPLGTPLVAATPQQRTNYRSPTRVRRGRRRGANLSLGSPTTASTPRIAVGDADRAGAGDVSTSGLDSDVIAETPVAARDPDSPAPLHVDSVPDLAALGVPPPDPGDAVASQQSRIEFASGGNDDDDDDFGGDVEKGGFSEAGGIADDNPDGAAVGTDTSGDAKGRHPWLSPAPRSPQSQSKASLASLARPGSATFVYAVEPPSASDLGSLSSLREAGILPVEHQDAYFSRESDRPNSVKYFGGIALPIPGPRWRFEWAKPRQSRWPECPRLSAGVAGRRPRNFKVDRPLTEFQLDACSRHVAGACVRLPLRTTKVPPSIDEAREWLAANPSRAAITVAAKARAQQAAASRASPALVSAAGAAAGSVRRVPRFDSNTGKLLSVGGTIAGADDVRPGSRGGAPAAHAVTAVVDARVHQRESPQSGSVMVAGRLLAKDRSQLTPPTQTPQSSVALSQQGFQHASRASADQHLTMLSFEVHVNTQGDLRPDPERDAIAAICYAIHDDNTIADGHHGRLDKGLPVSAKDGIIRGVILVPDAKGSRESQDAPAAAAAPAMRAGLAAGLAASDAVRAGSGAGAVGVSGSSAAISGAGASGSAPAHPRPMRTKFTSFLPEDDDATQQREVLGVGGSGAAASQAPARGPRQGDQHPARYEAPGSRFAFRNDVQTIDGLRTGVRVCKTETELFEAFVELVQRWDPDVVLGYEIQQLSLGYLLDRAKRLEIPLAQRLSRTPAEGVDRRHGLDEWGNTHGSGIWLRGRVILNVWRLMRTEIKLRIYSYENVVANVLKERVPHYPFEALTRWFEGGPLTRWRTLKYWTHRAATSMRLLDQLDLVGRTSEMARLFGIDFFSVLTRGSQYRVEAVMLRVAKPLNYVLVSASRPQVASQAAMEVQPLIMEPESAFYTSPVIVLDFQSLYPSCMIAYNLCYSTCMGRLSNSGDGTNERLGVCDYKHPTGSVADLHSKMFLSPNGVMYAGKPNRVGVLPRMLEEILATRVMVKNAMKTPEVRSDPVMTRILHARQFALKMLSNVTYGYTAAGFSGRMPCAEIADTIVACGRATLHHAINMVENHPTWDAKVVYGDTDSMFVHVEGRTRAQAFQIGREIAAAVTRSNPRPVTLKLEKVYMPCVMVTKKRYVGHMYERDDDMTGSLDCKGIEVVRRDQCPVTQILMEKSLRILFRTRDLSQVKEYLQRQWAKMREGRVHAHDFIFSKEVRLGTYSDRAQLPPSAYVASKMMSRDRRAEPRYRERVPYVVTHSMSGKERLVDMVLSPHEFLRKRHVVRLNMNYYITRQIVPALDRIFNLLGAETKSWYKDTASSSRGLRARRSQHVPFASRYEHRPRSERAPRAPRSAGPGLGDGWGRRPGGADGSEGSGSAAQAQAVPKVPAPTMWTAPRRRSTGPAGNRVGGGPRGAAGTINSYFKSQHCELCGQQSFTHICDSCMSNPQRLAYVALQRLGNAEQQLARTNALCRHCSGLHEEEGRISCDSLDCVVFFERSKTSDARGLALDLCEDIGLPTTGVMTGSSW